MRIIKLLPFLILTLANKCVYESQVLPSYGGIYQLDEKSIKYLGTGSAELRAGNPLNTNFPKYLSIFQRHYKYGDSKPKFYFSAFTVDEKKLNKEALLQGIYDEDTMQPNGVFISNDNVIPFKSQITKDWPYIDENGPYLGIDQGYACRHHIGGYVELLGFTPNQDELNKSYPKCKENKELGLCETPTHSWTELPIEDAGWDEKNVSMKVKYTAYKVIPGTGYKSACGVEDQTIQIEVTYKRVKALNMGDLRVLDVEHEDRITNWLHNLPSVAADAFGTSDEGQDLFDVFPVLPTN